MGKLLEKKEVSLVIGTIYEDLNELTILLKKLSSNLNYLNQIICVVSGVNTTEKKNKLSNLQEIVKIKIDIISLEKIVMPGEARNIGILKSQFEYISFLDSHTIPNENWLSNSIKIIEEKKLRGIIGRTKYIALNQFEKCFISATYGFKPLFSIPGTLIEKKLVREIGFFIPNNRSGEDVEWINRSKLFNPNLKQIEVIPLNYIGLKGKNFLMLCKKWYLFYTSTHLVPKFYIQRFCYLLFLVVSLIFLALSWNDDIANWNENSFLYVPHISKIVISTIILTYLIYRLVILPINKKVKIFTFNFVEFVEFSFISIALDFIKLLAFIKHKR